MRKKSLKQLVDDFDAGRTDAWIDTAPVIEFDIRLDKKRDMLMRIPRRLSKLIRDVIAATEVPKGKRSKAA